MFEIKKGFFIDTLKEFSLKHKKDILKDVSMLRDIKNYTFNEQIISLAKKLENKILSNSYLTINDIKIFNKINYLYYLKNFFPLNSNTIDLILKEYGYLINF